MDIQPPLHWFYLLLLNAFKKDLGQMFFPTTLNYFKLKPFLPLRGKEKKFIFWFWGAVKKRFLVVLAALFFPWKEKSWCGPRDPSIDQEPGDGGRGVRRQEMLYCNDWETWTASWEKLEDPEGKKWMELVKYIHLHKTFSITQNHWSGPHMGPFDFYPCHGIYITNFGCPLWPS